MERPSEIIWFERMIFGTLILGVLQSWLAWPMLVKMASPSFIFTTQMFTFAVIGGLTLLISRRRNNVAKWIAIVMLLLGTPIAVWQAVTGQMQGSALISIVQGAGQLFAYALLFTPASRAWFKSTDLKAIFEQSWTELLPSQHLVHQLSQTGEFSEAQSLATLHIFRQPRALEPELG
jgi:drug/metabolite transporter (DMT)-like permease